MLEPQLLTWLAPFLYEGRYLTKELMVPATDEPENGNGGALSIFAAVECLTKGIEVPRPPGFQFTDKDGVGRHCVRVRWWDEGATTFRTELPPEQLDALPDSSLPLHGRVAPTCKPVFFGHYWLTGTPSVQSSRAVCVDYSAGNGGPLVAYRFDGEPRLSSERLEWVGMMSDKDHFPEKIDHEALPTKLTPGWD